VKSDGSIGGYSRGIHEKVKHRRNEGIRIEEGRIPDFEEVFSDYLLSSFLACSLLFFGSFRAKLGSEAVTEQFPRSLI